jgi:hypothetical protein
MAKKKEKRIVYTIRNEDDAKKFVRAICEQWDKVFRRLRHSYWRSRFKALWERCATEGEFYELANELHRCAYGEELSHQQWSKAWQYRVILHEDFNQAILEFANAVIGWY